MGDEGGMMKMTLLWRCQGKATWGQALSGRAPPEYTGSSNISDYMCEF